MQKRHNFGDFKSRSYNFTQQTSLEEFGEIYFCKQKHASENFDISAKTTLNDVNLAQILSLGIFNIKFRAFKSIQPFVVCSTQRRGVMVFNTVHLLSAKSEVRFCAGSNPSRVMSEVSGSVNLKSTFNSFKHR